MHSTSQLPQYTNFDTHIREQVSKLWAPHFLVSMADNVLDTKLHTHFAIFLYALRLETAMLTKRVLLDAADAERCVKFLSLAHLPFGSTQPFEDNSDANISSAH
jgi:hypothetical protein